MKFINDWLPSISVIISAFVSWLVASLKAKNELKKLKVEYEHEDRESFSRAFAQLMSAASDYCFAQCQDTLAKAVYANSNLLSVSPKEFLSLVQEMNVALNAQNLPAIKETRDKMVSFLANIKKTR